MCISLRNSNNYWLTAWKGELRASGLHPGEYSRFRVFPRPTYRGDPRRFFQPTLLNVNSKLHKTLDGLLDKIAEHDATAIYGARIPPSPSNPRISRHSLLIVISPLHSPC